MISTSPKVVFFASTSGPDHQFVNRMNLVIPPRDTQLPYHGHVDFHLRMLALGVPHALTGMKAAFLRLQRPSEMADGPCSSHGLAGVVKPGILSFAGVDTRLLKPGEAQSTAPGYFVRVIISAVTDASAVPFLLFRQDAYVLWPAVELERRRQTAVLHYRATRSEVPTRARLF